MLEPGAVIQIINALNLKNSVAMEVGQNEIFSYMCLQCNPAPQQTPFEPIRDAVIQNYGHHGQDQYLCYIFQFILESGGRGSTHLEDYTAFLTACVNPKCRKLPSSVFKTLVQIPPEYPRFRLALLQWAWRQDTRGGWCPPPPDFSSRFQPDNPANALVSWITCFKHLESVLSHLRYIICAHILDDSTEHSAVAETIDETDPPAVAETRCTVVGEKNAGRSGCWSSTALSLPPWLVQTSQREHGTGHLSWQNWWWSWGIPLPIGCSFISENNGTAVMPFDPLLF